MQRWAYDKELYDQLRASIASSLNRSRNAERVELRRLERVLPDSQQVLKDGWTLNDPRLVTVLPESMVETNMLPPVAELPSKPTSGIQP